MPIKTRIALVAVLVVASMTASARDYNVTDFGAKADGTTLNTNIIQHAIDYVSAIGMDNIYKHEKELTEYCRAQLMQIDGMRIFGNSEHRSGLVSFLVGTIHPYDLGSILDKLGIAVRTGHHCAQPTMDFFGIDGTVRASFAIYNTKEEVDTLINGILRAKKLFDQL